MSQWMEVTHLPLGVICIHNQLHPVTDPFQSGSNKGPPAGTEFRSKGNPPSRGRAPGQVWAGLLPRASPPRGAGRSVCAGDAPPPSGIVSCAAAQRQRLWRRLRLGGPCAAGHTGFQSWEGTLV